MTPPSRWEVTLGEKLPLGAGDGISRTPIPVSDSIRREWQPDTKHQKKIDAKSFTIVLEFTLSDLLNNGLPWQHACRWGSQAAATARATVSNETGSEAGQESRADSDSGFRQT